MIGREPGVEQEHARPFTESKTRHNPVADRDTAMTSLIYAYLGFATLWLVVGTFVGEYLGIKFTAPDLEHVPWLSYGRLRPVHTNTVFWGWSSLALIGLALYVVPRTSNRRLFSLPLAWVSLVFINLAVVIGGVMLLSGINNGANMGDDTIYSGTVGAAMEGYLFGIPSIALSQVDKGWGELDSAARKAREIVEQMQRHKLVGGAPWLLNINIPNMPFDALRPLRLCRLGRRHAAERVIEQQSPRGELMYWIGGAGAAKDAAEGTDFHATAHGHVSMTPLKVDLTDHDGLGYWAQTAARLAVPGLSGGGL